MESWNTWHNWFLKCTGWTLLFLNAWGVALAKRELCCVLSSVGGVGHALWALQPEGGQAERQEAAGHQLQIQRGLHRACRLQSHHGIKKKTSSHPHPPTPPAAPKSSRACFLQTPREAAPVLPGPLRLLIWKTTAGIHHDSCVKHFDRTPSCSLPFSSSITNSQEEAIKLKKLKFGWKMLLVSSSTDFSSKLFIWMELCLQLYLFNLSVSLSVSEIVPLSFKQLRSYRIGRLSLTVPRANNASVLYVNINLCKAVFATPFPSPCRNPQKSLYLLNGKVPVWMESELRMSLSAEALIVW